MLKLPVDSNQNSYYIKFILENIKQNPRTCLDLIHENNPTKNLYLSVKKKIVTNRFKSINKKRNSGKLMTKNVKIVV